MAIPYAQPLRPLVAAIVLALSGSAGAGTLDVDGTNCTLVDAIKAANTDRRSGGCRAGRGSDNLRLMSPLCQ
jgi:hypothetical protein